jgi:hypothetical protein
MGMGRISTFGIAPERKNGRSFIGTAVELPLRWLDREISKADQRGAITYLNRVRT